MCGIFGIISSSNINLKELSILAKNARQRGKDSSGFLKYDGFKYSINRYDNDLIKSVKDINKNNKIVFGHSRLVTNSMVDNQPVFKNDISIIHNGIIVNFKNLFSKFKFKKDLNIDTEIILELFKFFLKQNKDLKSIVNLVLSTIEGSASCVVHLAKLGKLILFTNNGSLYLGKKKQTIYVSSESFSLKKIKCNEIKKVIEPVIIDVPLSEEEIVVKDFKVDRRSLVPDFPTSLISEKLLNYEINKIQLDYLMERVERLKIVIKNIRLTEIK